jgi:DNA modification methylase
VHPTQKPIAVCVDILSDVDGNVVADPYLGSGTTLIAAEQLNRKCYGMEIEPAYCDVIVQRWENLTGEKGERHG